MRNYLLYTFFVLLLTISTFLPIYAQNIEVQWGPILKADNRSHPNKIIGKDAAGFYVFKSGKENVLEKYDNNMNLVFTKELIIFLSKDKKTDFENIHMLNNKIVIFTSYYDTKKNSKVLFASYISAAGAIDPKLFQVAAFDNQVKEKDLYFDITLANDSSRFLIFSNHRETGEQKERFHYTIIDENFNSFVSTFVELPYKGLNIAIKDYIVDINNNIHMLYWINLKKEEENAPIDYTYYMFSYYSRTKETKEYDLGVGDNIISGIEMILDADNYFIYLPGFYSDKSENAFKGTFISKIDLINKKVVYSKRKDLSKEFIALFYKNPEKTKTKNKELYNYDTRFIYLTSEGELYTISEQYYSYMTSTYVPNANGGGTYTNTYHYNYDHLIAIKFDTEGNVAWSAKIPKHQHTINDYGFYSSVATIAHDKKVFMLYNDNPKNGTTLNAEAVMVYPLKSQTVIVSIDSDGNIEKSVLFKEQDRESIVRPKFTIQLSNDEVIIYSIRRNQYRYGKLIFKK